MERLTDKQRAWIDYYKSGCTPTEAAQKAGYKCKNPHSYDIIGQENLKKLAEYLKDRDEVLDTKRVADMEEINAFWTDTMRCESEPRATRLKASELRARALGAFVDNVNVHGGAPTVVILSGDGDIKD